jgi:hypothetical protein
MKKISLLQRCKALLINAYGAIANDVGSAPDDFMRES